MILNYLGGPGQITGVPFWLWVETVKGKEMDSPLQPPERNVALETP